MTANADWDIWKGDAAGAIETGETRLYFCPCDRLSPTENDLLLSWLDEDEIRRRARYRFESGRLLFGQSHGLTRYCLSLWTLAAGVGGDKGVHPKEWRFVADDLGKPRALLPEGVSGAEPPLFSLSHTHGAAAVAVSATGRLGVDIENRDRLADALPLAERFFAAEECRDILAQADDHARRERFLLYWTLKEAYLKALGFGLTKSLSSFAFEPDAGIARLLYDKDGSGEGWRFPFYDMPGGMTAALAIQSPNPDAAPYVKCFAHHAGAGWRARTMEEG